MVEQIVTSIIVISTFLVGYFIGRNEKISAPEIAEKIKKKLKMSAIKPGPLMRPTLKQIDRRQNKNIYEGVDEVKKAFDQLGVKNGKTTEVI